MADRRIGGRGGGHRAAGAVRMDAVVVSWSYRPSAPSDASWIAELRAVVMRPDLERLGRFDPVRVRQRFLDAFEPQLTRVIVVEGVDIGTIAVRPAAEAVWIEHFYLAPEWHGRGVGGAVLGATLAEARDDASPAPYRLNVLQGSGARRLYERHGFVVESEDEVDVFMKRVPVS